MLRYIRTIQEGGRESEQEADGWHWHHIVNKLEPNKTRFGRRLHCTDNLIALHKDVHSKVTGFYNSRPDWTKGKYVREVIVTRTWRKQYEFGLKVLRDRGIEP